MCRAVYLSYPDNFRNAGTLIYIDECLMSELMKWMCYIRDFVSLFKCQRTAQDATLIAFPAQCTSKVHQRNYILEGLERVGTRHHVLWITCGQKWPSACRRMGYKSSTSYAGTILQQRGGVNHIDAQLGSIFHAYPIRPLGDDWAQKGATRTV